MLAVSPALQAAVQSSRQAANAILMLPAVLLLAPMCGTAARSRPPTTACRSQAATARS